MENGHHDALLTDVSPSSQTITNLKISSELVTSSITDYSAGDSQSGEFARHNYSRTKLEKPVHEPSTISDDQSQTTGIFPARVEVAVEHLSPTHNRYAESTGNQPSNSFTQLSSLVTSGLPYINHSPYSAPVNLINPVTDPGLLGGYSPAAALVPNPHLPAYSPGPVGPLLIRPTGIPYMTANPLSGTSPTADIQSVSHTSFTAPTIPLMAASLVDPNTTPEEFSFHGPLNNQTPNVPKFPAPLSDTITTSDLADRSNGEYYVMVHVDAGATFSVRVGDQIQHIPGPATVRMVSNSGPPIPMPMQVPAGHLVQQIVDEEGILKHVILSLYPGPASPPTTTCPTSLNDGASAPGANVILDPSQHFSNPQAAHTHLPSSHSGVHNSSLVNSANRGPGNLGNISLGPFGHCAHSPLSTVGHFHSSFIAHPHVPVAHLPHHLHSPMVSHPFVSASAQIVHPPAEFKAYDMVNGLVSSTLTVADANTDNRTTGVEMTPMIVENSVSEENLTNRGKISDGAVSRTTLSDDITDDSDPNTGHNESSLVSERQFNVDRQSTCAIRAEATLRTSNTSLSMVDTGVQEAVPSNVSLENPLSVVSSPAVTDSCASNSCHDFNAPECFCRRKTSDQSQSHSSALADPLIHSHLTNDHAPSYASSVCSSRRRGRFGVGRPQGTFRNSQRTVPFTSTSTTASAVNSAPDGLATSSGILQLNSVESEEIALSSSAGGLLPASCEHAPERAGHSRLMNSWTKKERRSHPGYLLNTPTENADRLLCPNLDPELEVYLPVPDMIVDGDLLPGDTMRSQEAIRSVLSAIHPPQVSDVKPHSALVHLNLPENLSVRLCPHDDSSVNPYSVCQPAKQSLATKLENTSEDELATRVHFSRSVDTWMLDENAIQFELHLAERDSSARFNCVFIGEATDISLQDLRPGSDYFVKFCCIYGDVRGQFSSAVRFSTLSMVPSAPRNLTVIGHTRSSLHLKWNAATDNGSRITSYCVEYAPAVVRDQSSWAPDSDQSNFDFDFVPNFVEGFRGLARTCKLTQLAPSTTYLLRVMALNSHGTGPWSSVAVGSTSGSPPPTPPTPRLVSASVHTLTLEWHRLDQLNHRSTDGKRSLDASYMLEMDDEAMGHGFVTVFDGTGMEHCVENLRRNTRYRFRLAASNVDGRSRWTDVVVFSTLPDRPSAPENLRLIGPVRSTQATFTWDPPIDDGGLPVRSYHLELRLPSISIYSDELNEETQYSSGIGTPAGRSVADASTASLLCWPTATGIPNKTSFACGRDICSVSGFSSSQFVPPKLVNICSSLSSLSDSGHDSHCASAKRPTCDRNAVTDGSIPNELGSPAETNFLPSTSMDYPITETYQFHWFVVYEGIGNTVTVSNLLPGLQLFARVRAVSYQDSEDTSASCLLGVSSSPPLKLIIPPVPPAAPMFTPGIVDQPETSLLNLSWNPPKSDGGAPILTYELLQMDAESFVHCGEGDSCFTSHVANSRSVSPESSSDEISTFRSSNCWSEPTRRSRSLDLSCRSRCSCNVLIRRSGRAGRVIHTVPETECRVTNLRPGHSYVFRVRARNVIGWSPWSAPVTLSTMACPPAPPLKPPRVLPLSSTHVRVSWDPVKLTNGAPVKEYLLECGECFPDSNSSVVQLSGQSLDDSSNFQLIYVGPGLSYEFPGVRPASILRFRFCAMNSAGPGRWSPIATCRTPSTTPSQPGALKVAIQQSATTIVQWHAPDCNGFPITSFQIELRQLCSNSQTGVDQFIDIPAFVSDNFHSDEFSLPDQQSDKPVYTEKKKSSASSIIQHVFTSLKPKTAFQIRVRALNFLGYGPFSAPLTFISMPLLPGAPTFGTSTQLSANSVRLQWYLSADDADASEPPLPSCLSLDLRFRLQSSLDPDCEWTTIFEGPETVFKVTRLSENTPYYFRVQAINITGPGDWSEILHVTTLRLPPNMVRGLKVTEITVNSCHLDWSAVACTGSDPIIYVVHVLPLAAQTLLPTSQAQVYRSSMASCHVTDLAAGTEYICRVCAVRLCQPCGMPVNVINDSKFSDDGMSDIDESQQPEPASSLLVRKLLDGSVYHVTELVGPFSHSVQFATRPHKVPRSFVEGSSLPNIDSGFSKNLPLFRKFWSFVRAPPHPNKVDVEPAYSNQCPSISQYPTPWRRRAGPNMVNSSCTTCVPAQSSLTQCAKPVPHNFPTKRHYQWFRLSDRKLAFLFLLLFALITFLVSWSLQCFLSGQPSISSQTIHDIQSDFDL